VTIGTGDAARVSTYDQVVVAQGQDPTAANGPAGLLGRGGAKKLDGTGFEDVPAGTIALKPIFAKTANQSEPDLVGLESVDPPGIRLLGAAYANEKMAPWVQASDREAFKAGIERMKAADASTRDHGAISSDSTGVVGGIEHQRDKVPRANEVLGAKKLRLPGPETTLHLDPHDRSQWDAEVREFFATNLRADGEWVRVKQLTDGASGDIVYRVWVDENVVGVFKLFKGDGAAATEQQMLAMIDKAKLTKIKAVHERGIMSVDPRTGFKGAMLMDSAEGTSIKQMLQAIPADPAQHGRAVQELKVALEATAEGLAEFHAKVKATPGGARANLVGDANYMVEKNFHSDRDRPIRAALGDDFERVRAAVDVGSSAYESFVTANLPASVYHGDANAGNFIISGSGAKTEVGMIDVGAMQYSMKDNKRVGTGAADVARLLESLETMQTGKLTPAELTDLRDSFEKSYVAEFARQTHESLDQRSFDAARRWYTVELELTVLRGGDPTAKGRILRLLGLEASP
jgi:aminoglycoside phosphotransferase